jgi:hypothetical protein
MAVIYSDRMMVPAAASRRDPWAAIGLALAAVVAEATLADVPQVDIDRRVAAIIAAAKQRFPGPRAPRS